MNPVTLVRLWSKLLQDLEEDNLQSFLNKEVSKSEILDMVCAMRNPEDADKDNAQDWLQSDVCELGHPAHNRHGHCQCCHKTKWEVRRIKQSACQS
jgi:hypothetical protein